MAHTTTIITNVFNEEYLLPFWLDYHRRIFDHGIVIDYDSTDRSIAIIREMCPTWEIRRTENIVDGKALFETYRIEDECRKVEESVTEGYKIYLNTTEWLVLNRPLKDILAFEEKDKCYCLNVYLPLCEQDNFYPSSTTDFITHWKDKVVKANYIRGYRFIFNRDRGHYMLGRHFTYIPSDTPDGAYDRFSMNELGMCVFWCGYYPLNEDIWNRKLNVKKNMDRNIEYKPEENRNTARQHFYLLEDMKQECAEYMNHENHANKFQEAIQFCTSMITPNA